MEDEEELKRDTVQTETDLRGIETERYRGGTRETEIEETETEAGGAGIEVEIERKEEAGVLGIAGQIEKEEKEAGLPETGMTKTAGSRPSKKNLMDPLVTFLSNKKSRKKICNLIIIE
jgi:hypothetical protein